MNPGRLNRLVTLQAKTETQVSGVTIENWSDVATFRAAMEPIGSREFPALIKRNSESTVRFAIRYRPGIDPDTNRLVTIEDYDAATLVTHVWNIFPPYDYDPAKPRRWTAIEAKEVT